MNRGKQSKGIALISVLFIAAVVLILASTFVFVITRERQSTNSARVISDSVQIADAISERARIELVKIFKDSYVTADVFMAELDKAITKSGSTKIPALNALKNPSPLITIEEGRTGRWQIKANDYSTPVNGENSTSGELTKLAWIDVSATATTSTGTQTVIRRINMGEGDLFELAMLARDTNCIYCHLRVNGDVGSLGNLRPGWGTDLGGERPPEGWEEGWGSGGSGGGSVVNGDTYVANGAEASRDASENLDEEAVREDKDVDKKINGAIFNGSVEENYVGRPLPRDIDGDNVADFPAINRDVARNSAGGSISSAALIYTVDSDENLTSAPTSSNQTSLPSNIEGNVVLEGTKENPIILDGDIFVEGDVVIKGYVQGRGAIYSGRNVYVAGNIEYVDDVSTCVGETNPDQCARDIIAQGGSELRLASRNNTVLGDYTETTVDDSGTTVDKDWQGLQASDYFRSQFEFNDPNENKYFDTETGDELSYDPINEGYKNVDGEIVEDGNVKAIASIDAYQYSFQPGRVTENGGFDSWMSDDVYQDILGTETRKYDTWRYNIPDPTALTLEELQKQFAKYDLSDETLNLLLCEANCTTQRIDLKNAEGTVIGQVHIEDIEDSAAINLRVIVDTALSYEKQTTKVDAFIYSNQRIAGKTFNAPLSINGGMIGQEIGILAPGIERQWWMNNRYADILDGDCTSAAFAKTFSTEENGENSHAYNEDSVDCALTVNYDYRLRNGGLGFNLVVQEVGQTLSWQLADEKADQVQ
ncbi:MAG: hypothetical protein ACRCYY_09270 [Trueperaceae bacterium]